MAGLEVGLIDEVDLIEKEKEMKSAKYGNKLIALAFAILMVMACGVGNFGVVRGSGNVIEEKRTVSGISGVELATQGNLTIELGDTESLRIEAEDNLLEYFETTVRNGILIIRIRNNTNVRTTRPVNCYLTVKSVESIRIASSGDIQAPDLKTVQFSVNISSSGHLDMGSLEADSLKVKISSSGDVTMDELNADSLEVDISSSGNLTIAGGQVKSQNIDITSSGNYTAKNLASDEADVRISSSGEATIWAQDTLTVRLTSSGNVLYRGNPRVDLSSSSSGHVIQIGE